MAKRNHFFALLKPIVNSRNSHVRCFAMRDLVSIRNDTCDSVTFLISKKILYFNPPRFIELLVKINNFSRIWVVKPS